MKVPIKLTNSKIYIILKVGVFCLYFPINLNTKNHFVKELLV